jgi:hypothetical protein
VGGSGLDMSVWTWAAASQRGTSHEKTDTRIQDAYACFSPSSAAAAFVGIVSDGAGSATFGGQGASLVCRSLSVRARKHFSTFRSLPTNEVVERWFDETRDLIYAVSLRRGIDSRDFAATAICVLSLEAETVIAHVGDGCAVLQLEGTAGWIAPSWPNQGEFASTTFFVTDENLNLRVTRCSTRATALGVFSDGLERLVLNLSTRRPHEPFFNAMIAPVRASNKRGRDHDLSRHLRDYLGSATVNARTDDDKSLLLAVQT